MSEFENIGPSGQHPREVDVQRLNSGVTVKPHVVLVLDKQPVVQVMVEKVSGVNQ